MQTHASRKSGNSDSAVSTLRSVAARPKTVSPLSNHTFLRARHGALQPKLKIGAPNDAYEQEADRVAEQVMRMPDSQVLQRKCAACEDEDKQSLTIQRKATGDVAGAEAPPIVHEVLRSPGQPLDQATRNFMEPRFGRDFSDVRIHTDAKAAESARAVGALAYTVGRDIVFSSGQYGNSGASKSLVAHELAHSMQNARSTDRESTAMRSCTNVSSRSKQLRPSVPVKEARDATLARVDVPLYDCANRLAPVALRQAERSGLPGLHNGPADAYRHCWWSCEMTKQCSWLAAYVAGTGHEATSWAANESRMDLHNNAAGRDCGGETSSCDSCCRDKLANGQLTTLGGSASGANNYRGASPNTIRRATASGPKCPTTSCAGIPPSTCSMYAANSWWLPKAYVNNATLACMETPHEATANCVRKTLQDRLGATPSTVKKSAASMKWLEAVSTTLYDAYVIDKLTPRIYDDHVAAYRKAGCPSGPAQYLAWIAVTTIPMPAGTVGPSIRYGGGSCSGVWGRWC